MMEFEKRSPFGVRPRPDQNQGWEEVVPTTERFSEIDGSDVRLYRVRRFKQDGELVKTYLEDPMGQPFVDLPDIADDPAYLQSLKPANPERF